MRLLYLAVLAVAATGARTRTHNPKTTVEPVEVPEEVPVEASPDHSASHSPLPTTIPAYSSPK